MRSGGRRRSVVIAAVACAALMGLAGCSPGGAAARPAARRVLPAGAGAALGAGTLYLLLGNVAISANLWRVDLGSGRARQLTFNPPQYGVSNFSASTAGLVLGDARSGLDETEIMVRGRPRLLGGGAGDSPQINAAGQIVDAASAEQGVRHGPWSHDRLLYWASPSSPYQTIYQAPPENLASIAWNPAGTLILAVNGPDAYARLFAVNQHGRIVRRFLTVPGFPSGVAWGRYGLAVGYQTARPSIVVGMSGRALARLPGGWIPQCWNPAGTKLLVTTRDLERIGIWEPASPGEVQDLGRLPGGALQECSWTARPAPGT
jgi:hypothetical protein